MGTKKKMGTVVDENLLRRAKMAAAREGVPLSHLLENALQAYLGRRTTREGIGTVASTWGAMPADLSLIAEIMAEESVLET
ncbi:MAG: hypothetical protein HYY05_02955 [Chloroflexi bacterium]|nr:hypothetical protein [Chloroflexota bacterium]